MVELFILDKNFEILTVMDDFISLSWNPRFFGVGDFQLECSISYDDVVRNAKYISRAGKNGTVIIGSFSLLSDEVGGKSILVKGKFLKQILENRVFHRTMTHNNKGIEEVIFSYINNHFVINKPFNKLVTKRLGLATEKISTQVTGGSVLEKILKIEEEKNISVNVEYNPLTDKVECSVITGVNRSQNQNVNEWVVFSEEFENIYDYEYTKIYKTKNYAYVAGAGEGSERIIHVVNQRKSGEELLELYVDARDLQEEDENGHSIPREQYLKNLEQRGREKLAEYEEIQEIEAKVNPDGILKYAKDYNLGDIVDFVDSKRGIEATLRIVGVNEDIENGERKIELIFGKERLDLKSIIKREVV